MKSETEKKLEVLERRLRTQTDIDQASRLTQLSIASGISSSLPDTEPKKAQTPEEHTNIEHVSWMLDQVQKNFDEWPLTKLGRWVGIALACVVANGYIALKEVQKIVNDAKVAHGERVDEDLERHQDPDDPFQLEIGGES